MSTLIVAALFVGAIVAISLMLLAVANTQKRKKMKQLINSISEMGSAHNLSLSSQEVFNESVIALDGIQRKLLVLSQNRNSTFDDYIIDLDEVSNCTVKSQYGNIRPGDLKSRTLDTFLEKVVMHFEFRDGKDPVEVPLYSHIDNHLYDAHAIEQKAEHWKQMLTKMLKTQVRKTA